MKLKRSLLDYSMEFICILLMLGTIAYLVVMWPYIPDHIPVHFNMAGTADRIGHKNELIPLVVITWLIYIFLSLIQKHPASWNTGVRSGRRDKLHIYITVTHLISTEKAAVVAVFTYIIIWSSRSLDLFPYFLWISTGIIVCDLLYWVAKLAKIK